jgi:hypothetical protein
LKRLTGKLLVIIFGLSMFVEVALLPLFSSFAVEFETTVLAELPGEEKEQKTEWLKDFELVLHAPKELFPNTDNLNKLAYTNHPLDPNTGISDHVFLKNHSLRL